MYTRALTPACSEIPLLSSGTGSKRNTFWHTFAVGIVKPFIRFAGSPQTLAQTNATASFFVEDVASWAAFMFALTTATFVIPIEFLRA